MSFTAATFLSDTIKFIRDSLSDNITDPKSSSRVGRERFVMTSYPQRPVKYPIITVMHRNTSQIRRLGLRSEGSLMNIPIEIRIWARNIKEKDQITDEVFTFLRTNQFGTDSTSEFELHDFKLISSVDVLEEGDDSPKSRVMEYEYIAVVDS